MRLVHPMFHDYRYPYFSAGQGLSMLKGFKKVGRYDGELLHCVMRLMQAKHGEAGRELVA